MYDVNELARMALDARKDSFCFISNFAVGAALVGKSGKIWRGMNIECSGQTPSLCAERVAMFKALSEGEKGFVALAVAGGPAGALRQRRSWGAHRAHQRQADGPL